MSSPVVTVVIAAYNSSRTLRCTIESLRAQTLTDWEAWIIGDGCTDDSGEVVASFAASFKDARLNWHNLDSNHGSQYFANNEGIRRAKGTYIAYLGHDDLWFADHLADLVRTLEESDADFAHSVCGIFDAEKLRRTKGPPIRGQSYANHFVPPSAWMHRRSLVAEIGYWNDPNTLPHQLEIDYPRRVFLAGKKIAFCPRLSVIKIPTHTIGLYSLKGAPPQEAIWAQMRDNLPALQYKMMGEAAAKLSQLEWGRPTDTLAAAVGRVLGILKRAVTPKPTLEQRIEANRKSRASYTERRGLPADHAAKK
jgi:hypothetical protein